MSDAAVIWYRDPRAFLSDRNVAVFVPTAEMSRTEQLNALVRFAAYLSVLLMILRRSATPAFVLVFVMMLTAAIAEADDGSEAYRSPEPPGPPGGGEEHVAQARRRPRHAKKCRRPTRENPFMNRNFTDAADDGRAPACDVMRRDVQARVEDLFSEKLYRDVDDVYGSRASSRQWYTVPVTTAVNDQTGFARWLYGTVGRTKNVHENNAGRV